MLNSAGNASMSQLHQLDRANASRCNAIDERIRQLNAEFRRDMTTHEAKIHDLGMKLARTEAELASLRVRTADDLRHVRTDAEFHQRLHEYTHWFFAIWVVAIVIIIGVVAAN